MKNLFQGKRIRLTAPYEGDGQAMLDWYEDAGFLRLLDTDPAFPKTAEDLQKECVSAPNLYHFRIRTLSGERLLGFVSLHSIEWNNQTASLSMGIGQAEYRGKGYGSEAMQLVLQYAFGELGLHRVGLDAISYNTDAIRLYERFGFVMEGQVRECVYRDNHRYDRVYMGLLREEWFAR